jgi:HlyD family secretion protein
VTSQIFRKASLDRLSSPDELDRLLTVTSPRSWAWFSAVSLMLGVAWAWAFYGSIPTKVEGSGVLIRSGGVFNISSNGGGRLIDLQVKAGDQVRADQVVALVAQPELKQKLRNASEEIISAEQQRDQALSAQAEGVRLNENILRRQGDDMQADLNELQHEEQIAADQIATDENLVTGGVLPRETLVGDRDKLAQLQSRSAQLKTQITKLSAERQQLETQLAEARVTWNSRLQDLERSQRLLKLDMFEMSQVKSPYSGRALEVKVAAGALVAAGSPIVSIEPAVKLLEVISYVAASRAKSIQEGMDVEVSPSTVKAEEYGFIRGKVVFVATFPATPAAMMKTLENEPLAVSLAKTAVTEVRVSLETSPTSPSGFRWSSPRGPNIQVNSGTLVSLQIVTEERRPASFIIPLLKEKLGVS